MDPRILHMLGTSGRPTGLKFLASSESAASAGITIPADAQPGDVAVLVDSGLAQDSTPSGWTRISLAEAISGFFLYLSTTISYRVLQSGDAGSTVTARTDTRKLLLVFRPDRPASSVAVGSLNSQGTFSDPAQQTVSASSGAAPLVVLAVYRAPSTLSSLTFSPAQDGEVTQSDRMAVRYKIAAVDLTVDMPDIDYQTLQSFYLRVN